MNNLYENNGDCKYFVKPVSIEEVPVSASVISWQALHKIIQQEDGALSFKFQTFSHGNKASFTFLVNKDCAVSPPLGLRIVMSTFCVSP